MNIEIKAKCSSRSKIRQLLKSQKAHFRGKDHQIDTYFKVASGRLKLRAGNIENYLIHYDREDKRDPKQSSVTLFKTNPDSSLKEVLTRSLGILVVVDKQREIYFIENLKFHIDDVRGLGYFVEIEAIDKNGLIGKEKLLKQCQNYVNIFGIKEEDLISKSYSDLLLRKKSKHLYSLGCKATD